MNNMNMTNTSETVLLLEDDRALNRAVSFKLKQKGHNVISTERAEEALDVLDAQHPKVDVIWLDLLLPKMNGMEFLSRLRSKPEYRDTKVVICSVSGREESRGIARGLGAVDYLIKSDYNLDSLTDKVLSYA